MLVPFDEKQTNIGKNYFVIFLKVNYLFYHSWLFVRRRIRNLLSGSATLMKTNKLLVCCTVLRRNCPFPSPSTTASSTQYS